MASHHDARSVSHRARRASSDGGRSMRAARGFRSRSSPASSAPARPRWCGVFWNRPKATAPPSSSTNSAASASTTRWCATPADEITLLGNGCLCCNTRTDLQNALRRLVAERERGTVPSFRRVLIETSGLADPGPILQTFATDRALGGEFHVEVVRDRGRRRQRARHARMVGGGAQAGDPGRPAGRSRRPISRTPTRRAADRAPARSQSAAPRSTSRSPATSIRARSPTPPSDSARAAAIHTGFVAEAEHTDDIASFVMD